MNIKSREKLLAGVAALSLLGISPQQTFAARISTSQAVQQTKKTLVTFLTQWDLSLAQQ